MSRSFRGIIRPSNVPASTPYLLFLILSVLWVVFQVSEAQCPDADLILPCACDYNEEQGTDFFCGNVTSSAQLSQVFAQDFPMNTLTRFWAWGSGLESLPSGVFGLKTFAEINVGNTPLSFIDPGLFASEEFSERLVDLFATRSRLNNFFDLGLLDLLPNLESLSLGSIGIQNLPLSVEGGDKLKSLFLNDNELVALHPTTFSNLQNLTTLDLSGNSIVELGAGVFSQMSSLKMLYLGNNSMENLDSGALTFDSPDLDYVDLSDNLIVTLPEAVAGGQFSSMRLDLRGNLIATFPESVFRPILDAFMAAQQGTIFLDGNPLTCGCDMQWLLDTACDDENQECYLSHVYGTCPNGSQMSELKAEDFVGCR